MKRWLCVLAGLAVLCVGCATTNESTNTDAEVAAINQMWETYSLAVEDGDSDTWLSLWDGDGIPMPPNTAARGFQVLSDIVPKAWASIPQGTVIEMNIVPEETVVSGDWAFSRGTYTKTTTPPGGKTATINGKFLTVLRKQLDGACKIFRDCFNSNVPPS